MVTFISLLGAVNAPAEWVDADGEGLESALLSSISPDDWWGFALDSQGSPHIVFDSYADGIHYSHYIPCQGWEEDVIASPYAIDPLVRIDSQDRPHLLMLHESNPHNYSYLYYNGVEWVDADGIGQESAGIETGPYNIVPEGFRLDSQDRPHIMLNGPGSQYQYLYWDGEAWNQLPEFTEQIFIPFEIYDLRMLLDSQDRPHLVFSDYDNRVYHLYFDQGEWSMLGGGPFEPIMELTNNGYWEIAFVLDSLDHPHIIGNPTGTAAAYLCWNGEEWTDGDGYGQESLIIQGPIGYYLNVACDSEDRLHVISCVPGWDHQICYIVLDGTTWYDSEGEEEGYPLVPLTAEPQTSLHLALDSQDRPHLNWWNYFNEMYYIRYSDGDNPESPPQVKTWPDKLSYEGGEPVTLTVQTLDPCGQGIEKVELSLEDSQGTAYSPQAWEATAPEGCWEESKLFTHNYFNLPPGEYTARATAFPCSAGALFEAECWFTVKEKAIPPVVSIFTDLDTYFPGQAIYFTINASAGPKIDWIQWRLVPETGPKGTWIEVEGTEEAQKYFLGIHYYLKTLTLSTTLPAGSYCLEAKVKAPGFPSKTALSKKFEVVAPDFKDKEPKVWISAI
ncbi:MAG: hypothetical protein V1789_08540, partial [PVC group bacterium]